MIDELANVFESEEATSSLLASIGFPPSRRPEAKGSHFAFWQKVYREVEKGLTPGGLEALLQAAAYFYPHNPVFKPWAPTAPGTRSAPSIAINRMSASRLVSRWIEEAPGPRGLLPVHIEHETEDLVEYVQNWLATPNVPTAIILTGPLGGGKTIASCQLHRALQGGAEKDALDLWLPFRDTNLFVDDPEVSIKKLLGIDQSINLWDRVSGLRCIMLDGIDEAITKLDVKRVRVWINTLFQRALESALRPRPRFLIIGRDVAMDRAVIHREILEALQAFNDASQLVEPKPPIILRLKSWDDDYLRNTLEGKLSDELDDSASAEQLMRSVSSGVLSSPLLYGLAYDVLIALNRNVGPGMTPPITSPWRLLSIWVDYIINRDFLKHPGPSNRSRRRDAVCAVALLLALSGRGVAGVSLEPLQKSPLMQRVWFGSDRSRSRLEELLWELRTGCLLSCHDGLYAPFHQGILIHLAAEALDRFGLMGVGPGGPPPAPPAPPAPPPGGDPGPKRDLIGSSPIVIVPGIARSVAVTAELPRLIAESFEEPDLPLSESALQPGSIFEDVLSYWARHHPCSSPLPSLELEIPAGRSREDPDLLLAGARVMVRDALVSSYRGSSDPLAQAQARATPASPLPPILPVGINLPALEPIPPGTYPMWRFEDGQRYLASHELDETVYLSQHLCTVEEYALFLEAAASRSLPDQPEARWRSSAEGVSYRESARRLPVSGISQEDAKAYCRWLSPNLKIGAGEPAIEFRLPDPDWLRIAVWGPEIRELPWRGVGPFGHEGLLGHRWQWTSNAQVFGGSDDLGPDEAGIQKTLLRGWPDLCREINPGSRNRDLGFRACVVVYSREAT